MPPAAHHPPAWARPPICPACPARAGELTSLRVLVLSDCSLPAVPPWVRRLSGPGGQLAQLDLSRNQLAELPPWLQACSRLKVPRGGRGGLRDQHVGCGVDWMQASKRSRHAAYGRMHMPAM